jgi:hypothetical protein
LEQLMRRQLKQHCPKTGSNVSLVVYRRDFGGRNFIFRRAPLREAQAKQVPAGMEPVPGLRPYLIRSNVAVRVDRGRALRVHFGICGRGYHS